MEKAKQNLIVYSRKKHARRATTTTMAEWNDDLILEIIARLPLNYAVQCLLLNKKFLHQISQPTFLRQNGLFSPSSRNSNTTNIFHYSRNTLTRINPRISTVDLNPQASATLTLEPSILASCNGVLLLRFREDARHSHFVFNPLTGGIMHFDYPLHLFHDVGLAVDLDDGRNSHFKLVTIRRVYTKMSFGIVVPSSGGAAAAPSVVEESKVKIVCPNFTLMPAIYTCLRPIYVHGCMHWLGNGGKKILSFDVEKKKMRIIDGPVEEKEPEFHSGVGKWFGFADGSIQFVYTLKEEIAIKSYNYLKNEWRVKHKIGIGICSPSNIDWWDAVALIFDGRRLFVQLHEGDGFGVVLARDILGGKWERMGKVVEGRPDSFQRFFSFSPTLAKVSHIYLHDNNEEFASGLLNYSTDIKSSLEELQRLVM